MIDFNRYIADINGSLNMLRNHAANESIALKIDSIKKQVNAVAKTYVYRKATKEFNRTLTGRLRIVAKLSKYTLSKIAHEYCLPRSLLSNAIAGKSKSMRARIALAGAWKLDLREIQDIYKHDSKNAPSVLQLKGFHERYERIIKKGAA